MRRAATLTGEVRFADDGRMGVLHIHDLHRISYTAALDRQTRLVEEVCAGGDDAPGHLLLLEHDPPVITLGRRGKDRDLLRPREALSAMGIEVLESRRGGEVTYHGPGQLVLYAIHRLQLPHLGVRDHVRGLEETILRTLRGFGIAAERGDPKAGLTGVWTPASTNRPAEKIAAVGVAVRRWVTYHGAALNVCTDLRRFELIVPCGLAGKGVTSMQARLARDVSIEEVKPKLIDAFRDVFGYKNL